ncbi:MAG: hypothetical protein WD877_01855 [Candidatus Saccharimonadales bacterium]
MAYKNIEDSRAAIRRHYYANKQVYLEKNKKRRARLKKYLREIKENSACTDCQKNYPYYVMDFDHLENKLGLISYIIKKDNFTALKAEIEKCEVVCANCHRFRSHKRQLINSNL